MPKSGSEEKELDQMSSTAAALFGDDDLGRVQGILFGDHARRTAERIDTLEQALLGVVADLRSHIDKEFEALNSRLDAEAETRAKAVSNVGDRLQEEIRNRSQGQTVLKNDLERSDKKLRSDLDRSHENLTGALDQLEKRSGKSLDTARSELAADFEANLQSLGEVSVARQDLAAALRQAAEAIAGIE